jgi:DNA-binding transcriptional LysR family regulator
MSQAVAGGTDLNERDLRHLIIFRAVAQAGGFTAAERALGMERSTISRHIKTLEDRLGGRLCQRGPRGFELTEFGNAALSAATTLSDTMDVVRNRLNVMNKAIVGEVRLGVADNCFTNPAAQISVALERLCARAPAVDLHVSIMSPAEAIAALMARRLHATIAGLPPGETRLDAVPLFSEEFRLYACPGADGPVPHVDTLAAEGYGVVVRDAERSPFGASRLKLKVERRVHASGLEAVLTLVATGRFVGLLPAHLVDSVRGFRRFVEVRGAERLTPTSDFCFITERDRTLGAAVMAVRDEMAAAHRLD